MPEGEQEVARKELVHGYELERGEYVLIEDSDLKSVRLESTKTIQIERFVDAASIDRLYWDQPYFMAPSGKKDLQEPFAVIRDAMEKAGRVALGRVVMTGRERMVASNRGMGDCCCPPCIRMTRCGRTRRCSPDWRELKGDPQMVEIAEAIIGKQAGVFDPSEFHDRYAEALRELVEQKAAHSECSGGGRAG